jgi:hypothetical protein
MWSKLRTRHSMEMSVLLHAPVALLPPPPSPVKETLVIIENEIEWTQRRSGLLKKKKYLVTTGNGNPDRPAPTLIITLCFKTDTMKCAVR